LLDTGIAAIAALVAVATFAGTVLLWRQWPRAEVSGDGGELSRTVSRLEHEVEERMQAEQALRRSQATLRELADYRDRIREDERKRIAREIHDDLGQNLLALRLDVASLHARTRGRQRRLHEQVGAMLACIDATMKSVRGIINNLRPSVLDLGLFAAIEWQVAEFRRVGSIDCACALDNDGPEPALSDEQATTVFRVLQESLTNIRRHARADQVRVALTVGQGLLSMSVQDNGVGMVSDDRRKSHRYGLMGMEERLASLGGSLRIDSAPGEGTCLRLTLPLVPRPTPVPQEERRHLA
jgi:signal transduction histidine kinase